MNTKKEYVSPEAQVVSFNLTEVTNAALDDEDYSFTTSGIDQ